MGNCATKPKALKDSDGAPPPAPLPAEEEQPMEPPQKKDKGKQIVVEGDNGEEHGDKRQSLSDLFMEDELKEIIEKQQKESDSVKKETESQTGSSETLNPEASVQEAASEIKVPEGSTRLLKAKVDEIPPEQAPVLELEASVLEASEAKVLEVSTKKLPEARVSEIASVNKETNAKETETKPVETMLKHTTEETENQDNDSPE